MRYSMPIVILIIVLGGCTFLSAQEASNASALTMNEVEAAKPMMYNEIDTKESVSMDKGNRFGIWLPRVVFRVGSWFIPREDQDLRKLVRRIRSVKVKLREGSKNTSGYRSKMERRSERRSRRNYENLAEIEADGMQVEISMRQKKNGNIKGLVVMVNEESESVFVKLRSNLRMKHLQQVMNEYDLGLNDLDIMLEVKEELEKH